MAQKTIGYISELSGSAEIRSFEGIIRVIKVGDIVRDGDVLITGKSTQVVVTFYDGHQLRLGEEAEVLLDDTVSYNGSYEQGEVDQVLSLQQAIIDGIDLADLEETAAGVATSAGANADGLHQASIYERNAQEGQVDSRLSPFATGSLSDNSNDFRGDDDILLFGDFEATISINSITSDNVINLAESTSSIPVTGVVDGSARAGDTITLQINGNTYTSTVGSDNTFTVDVPGTDLVADTEISATVEDAAGNFYSASTNASHQVDLEASASITVDDITLDDVISFAESGQSVNVTGSVAGDASEGDTVSFTVNGTDYSGTVASDNTFSIAVAGSDLMNETSFDATVSGADNVDNPFAAATTSVHLVDVHVPTASIVLDTNITADDIINALEESSDITVSGTVGGDVVDGDTVTLTINETVFTGTVSGGAFSVNIPGTALTADSDATIEASVTTSTGSVNGEATASTSETYLIDTINPVVNDQSFDYSEDQVEDALIATVNASDNVAVSRFQFDNGTQISDDGYFSINNNGEIRITAAGVASEINDFSVGNSSHSYTVEVIDTAGNLNSSVVTLNELRVNDLPIAGDDSITTDEDTLINATVPVATDADGNIVSYVLETNANQGTLTFNNDGSYRFEPGTDFDDLAIGQTREVSFRYTATDNDGGVSQPATVTITVTGVNDPAVVSSDAQTLAETDAPLVTIGTLTSTDPDNTDNSFTPANITGTIGDLVLLADGSWTFTANSAFDHLNIGDSVNETFNVTSEDGTPTTVQITINGSNDAATVSSDAQTLIETDAPLVTTGTLTSTDVDNTDNLFTPATINGTIGDLVLLADGSWTFTANSAFDNLNVGDSVNETFNVTSEDGTPTTVQITINGTNDAATVSSDSQTLTETDAPLVTTGTLTSTDPDNTDNSFTPATINGTIGDLVLLADGSWTFTANSAFDNLNVGDSVNETFNVTSEDGTPTTVQITINGTNDAATVSSDSQTLTETDAPLVTTGTLTSTDPDNTDNNFTPATINGTIGDLVLLADGNWTFTANSAFDHLNVGDNVNETFNVTTEDGTPTTVQITINGTNDTATVSSDSQTLTETDAPLVTTGTLTSTDVDNTDNSFMPANINGSIGDLVLLADGSWTFTANSAFDNLNVGDSVNETFNVTSEDGTPTTVQVTINGTNDAATVSSDSQTLTETDAPLITTGTLTSTDVDNTDNSFTPTTINGTIGDLVLLVDGSWTFTANSAFDNLNVGDSVNETFNVTSEDGTPTTVQITINGTNDAATVSSDSQTLTETDVPLVTTGTLTSTDVDNTDNSFTPANITGAIGDLVLLADGSWTFTANSAFDNLNVGDSVNETFNVTSEDGTPTTVQITINGTNDAATVSSDSQTLTETDAPLVTTGTLTSTDPDNTDNSFTPANITGTIGDLVLLADGSWTFTANSAFDELDPGDTVNEIFNITTEDGTPTTIQITINGTNDLPTVSGTFIGTVSEDNILTTSGNLSISDVDGDDNPVFNDVVVTNGDNNYGTFELTGGVWTYTLNNGHPAVQGLSNGDSLTDTITFVATDGTNQVITVTINGTNDAATVSSDSQTLTETDAPLVTTGTLTSTDVDNTDNSFTPATINGTIGDLVLLTDGSWTFTANSAFDNLNVGDSVNETFNVTSEDGTPTTVQITINGTNDAATVSSDAQTLIETDAPLVTTGTLTSTDVDNTDNSFTPATINGTIGDLVLLADGSWTFTANSAFDNLNVGDSVNETFNVTSEDGTPTTVQITINGTNDAATVSSDAQTLTETDAPLVTTGTLTSTDPDNTDNSFTPATINGTIGDLVLLADGSWTFTANSAFDNLNVGDSVNETFNVTSEDGTPTTVQITINGTNDAATVSSDSQTLTETDVPLVTTGTLTSTDVDNTDNSFTPANITGTIGDLVLLADGSWTFTANSAFDHLNVGDSVNETFNVTSEDGTPTTVQITINGTNDVATVSSDAQTLTETDAPLVTTGTLTSTDVDNTDNSFTPATINGTIGDLVLLADGSWTFTANSAFDNLNVGDSVNETFNVTSEDGTPTTVQITINGTNDAATVSSDAQTLIETDAPLVTTGTLTSTDVDNTDNSFTPATINGTIGDLVLLADGSWTFTANSAFDNLNVGDSVNETFNVTSEDGTPTTVQITINGTNDAATVSSDAQTLIETDAPLVTTGTLTSTDVDNTDNSFTPATINGTIGDLVLLADGSWTFTANSAFDNLNVGDSVNETFNVTSEDGTPTTVQITINGTNDAATVSSDSQTLTETDAPLITTGTLTSTDVDNTDNSFTPATINGTIGDLVLLADGSWTFTANSAFDNLNVGDSVNETFNVTSEDGTPTTVQITINGTNDAATVSSDSQTLTETDAPLVTTGTLTSTDVDNTDNSFTPANITGAIGDLVLLADGSWTFTANSAFDNLNVGDSVNETFNVTSEDGTPTTVQITINGTNDAATVSSDAQTLAETDAPLVTTGTLTSTDVDNTDNSFTPATINGTIGDLVLLADGSWTFTANSAFDNLNVGDSVNETFNVTSEDSTPTTVQITINGTNDAATVSSDSQTLSETDAPLVTTGTLTSTDVDNTDNSFTPATINGTIGDLVLLADGSWTFTANSAFDNLNVGDSVNETFNVTSEDGTPTTVQITINGTNDAATVSSDSQTLTETDAPLVTTGTLTSTDVDNTDNSFIPATINGTIGDLVLLADGSWTFTANSEFDNLNVGDSVNETFNVTSEDGTPTTVQITINGTNDAATVSSDAQTLVETDAPLVTTGTLTSTDVDNTDNSFTPATINGTIGDLVLLADGSWTFTANSAFDNLNVGDSVNETFNVTSEDGTPTTVQITINGTNDAATVSSDAQTLVETDAPLVTTGTLTSTDVDNTDNSFTPATINGTIGDLVLLADGSWTFTANSAFDNLNVGDSVNETFNVTSEDGTPTTVQITINGTNDAATVSSDSQTLTETDAPLITTGTLTSTDVDNTDNSFTPATINGTIGDLVLLADGSWTFTANSAFDNLNVGDSVNETFNVTSEDGTPTTVQITINGTNDAATVSSDAQTLTETDAPLVTTGTLTSTDPDNTDNSFTPATINGTIGDLVLLADGSWTFTANSAFDNLNVGDSVNETFNVTSEDGTPTTVQITINGTNDAATVSSDSQTLTETDAPLITTGTLTSTDVDNTDNSFTPATINGTIGDLVLLADGSWTFTANSAFDNLNVGDSVNETFNVTSEDGTPTTVQITINGTNDAATVSSDSQTLTETDAPLVTTGTLTSTDVDNTDNSFIPATINGTIGDLVLLADGSWTFTANSEFDNLNVGDSVNETFNVTSEDGTPTTVQITINGTNDAATVSSDSQTLTETDAPLITTGTLTSTDVDNADNSFTPATINGTIGDLILLADGSWTFTANSAFDNLNVGDSVNETFNVTSEDGTSTTVQITINGTNDAATVSSDTQTLTETDAPLITTGTLTSTDVDNTDNSFTPATINGTIGDLVLLADGSWTFTANSAFDNLNVGDSVNETFNVTSEDGTPTTVQITINGTNDAPTVSGIFSGTVVEDTTLSASGALSISDVDNTPTFNDTGVLSGDNNYGTFQLTGGTWVYSLNNSNLAVQALDTGDTLTDSITFTATDGTTQIITITIEGLDEGAIITADDSGTITEDAAPNTVSGDVLANDSDPDGDPLSVIEVNGVSGNVNNAVLGTYGEINISNTGGYTYTLNNSSAATQALADGQIVTETFSYTVDDGFGNTSKANVVITITGTNDAATVSSDTQTLTETDAPLITTGTLTSTDVDNTDNSFTPATINGTIGDLVLLADGSWTFTANSAFDNLNVGDSVNETFNVTSEDGTPTTVQITINGTNDAATVSSDAQTLIETDAPLVTTGTLTSTDVDNTDNSFIPATINGTIGDLVLLADGSWTFTASSAFDNLNVGDSVNETFNVTSEDGTPTTVQITINGTNDAATVSSDSQTLVETDAPLITTGTLTSTDVDNTDNSFTPATINGTIGDLVLLADGSWTFTANSAFDNLNVGDSVNETFNVTSEDGTPTTVQITINGTNDAATVSSDSQTLTETDAPLVTTGTLTSTDVDNTDNSFTPATINGTIGDLVLLADGSWTFTANSAFDHLNVGDSVNETFNVTSEDGTPTTVQITINGTNDAATVSSDSQTLTETDAPLVTTGTLTSTDPDNTDNSFTPATINGTIGDLVLLADGSWTFTANSAFDNLNVGDSVNETFNVTSEDGTPTTVQITINGTNDAATVSSDSQTLTETDAPLVTTGTLTSTDPDNTDNSFTPATINGTIGDLVLLADGSWTFTANSAFDNLNVGDSVNETFNVTSEDGTPTTVQITINGTNDAATVSSDSQTLTETDAPLVTTGTLTSTDPDNTDNSFTPATINGTIGDLVLLADGSWTFTANSAFDNLNVGDSVNETFNVTSEDGTPTTIQITINGTNDAATVSSDSQTLVETDAPLVTTGTLTSTDVDNTDNSFTPATINGTIGDLVLLADGSWTFTANSAFDNLNVGDSVNETFNVTSEDGTPTTVQITINGTNDAATVSSDSQTLTETDAPLVTTGTLTSTDVDNADNSFTPATINGTIGDLILLADGSWTFTANSAFDNLNVGDSVNEIFNVTSEDGTPTTVQITINGTNDAATVSSDAQTLTETDAPLVTTGTLTSTDPDNTDNSFTPATINGTIGDLVLLADGSWTFTANSAFDNLNVGDSVNETFNVTSEDGTPTTVQITINGTNDAATVSSDSQTLTETDALLITTGTLTSTDVDNTDNSFTPATINGTIGDLVLLADGSWTFTANSAFDNLNVGDSVNETFNVTSEDGTPTTVQITINGTNDAATVSSDSQTLTETDAPLITTGTLTSTDPDNTDNSFTPATINGTIGDLVLLADGSWTFTANSAFDNLNVGDSVNETFNVTSEDGTPTTVQITINGTNDAATVSSDAQTLVETSAPLVTTGTLTSTDVDNTDNSFTPATINGTIGDLVLLADGSWTFTANSAFDNLNVGDSVNETFNVTSEDGTPTTVQITINGTNDAATVSSDSQTLSETDAPLVTTGTLTSTDVDNADNSFTPANITGTIGDLVLLADGSWTFTANSAFDNLNVGDSVNETFNVTSEDGTPTTVQITINGTNDAATVSSDSQTLSETDAPLVTTGTLTSTDPDNTDNSFTPATINGTIGDLVLLADGSWTFTANSAFDNLNVGDSVNETFNVTSEDGTPTTVQITINGTNDAATVSSDAQTLTETDAPLVTTGTLTSTDPDNTDNSFTPATINGTIGDLVLLADGSWTFTANSAFDNLNVGDSVNETFNVTSEDGTPTTVQITINGTNDAATVSSDSQTLTETDAPLVTTGTLTSTDVDNTDNSFIPATINGTIGDLVLLADGSWTFTANSAFDNLNVGDSVNETFNVTSEDGTPTTVQITINGTNDVATVSSDSQTLTETDASLVTTGTLTSTDVDNTDNSFTPATINGTIGDLVLLADGSWTFTANSAFDNLNVGDSVNETFNVTSEDGTPTTVQITINGTNDAATVSSDAQTLTETDAPLVTTGTLTSTDPDNTDNSFTPATITGTIGDLVLLADGSWTFTANSAFDNLNVGDSVNETFNVTSEDGTPTTVQITINGTNDAATVSSDAQTLVETDAPLITMGTLTSTDVDNTDNSFTPATINGTIGDLVLLADGSWTFTANSAFDNLNVGDSVNETFNVTSEDGTPTTVQITINGTNDAATVSSDTQTLTETDAPLVTTGTLTSTDVDNTDNSFTPATINGTIGDLVLLADGSWTFTANSAFDNLNVGDSVNETFNVTSEDGTPTTVQITINGTNDAATVSSDAQTLTETDAPLVTTGTLTSTDVDNTDNSFTPATINGTIGDLVLLADGSWTFTANSAFDNLNVGDSVNETFNVTSEDGTPTTVQITINGTNDAATVSSDSQTLSETDAPLVTTGTLTSTDPDNTDNSFTPATINGTIGDLVLLADGSWTFTANSAFDNLNVGDSVNETFNITSEDGTPTTVQITINGTNDVATVSSDSQTLTETDASLVTTGTLTSTDVDNTDNSFTPATINGTIGDLVLLADGSWTFTANSAFDNLNVGDSVNETFNVTSEDGTPTTVQITINGTNDAATVSSDTQTLTETDAPLVTTGTLTSTDPDNTDNSFTPATINGTIGDLVLLADGSWTFTANSAFDNLNVGDSVNETFNVTSEDGTPTTVQITINGTNDAATVSSDAQTLVETDAPLITTGTLTSTDVDNTDNSFTPATINGTIGDLVLLADGSWTFTANSAFDNLNVGDSVNETFNVTSEDGTPTTVQITINGTNDAATVSSDSQTLTETDAPLVTTGTLTSTDVDNTDNSFTPATINGTIGDLVLLADGSWTFTANSAFDNLNVGDSVNETFNVTSEDGTPLTTVQITINGTNDAATVSSDSQTLTETDAPMHHCYYRHFNLYGCG